MLTNELRKAFGIKEIQPDWTKIPLKGHGEVYYDKQLILQKFVLEGSENEIFHRETDHNLQLDENLNIIGKKGKIQKLSYSVLEKYKPSGIYLFINKNIIELYNYKNHQRLIEERQLNLKSKNDVRSFFKNRISDQTEYQKTELFKFINAKDEKKLKLKTGDIFRVKIAENYFAYGRVISNLYNFHDYSPIIQPDRPKDFANRSLFNTLPFDTSVLVDFFVTLTDNPHLGIEELKLKPTTFSLMFPLGICESYFTVIDYFDIRLESFNIPMSLDVNYSNEPFTHMFKWGPDLKLIEPDETLRKEFINAPIDRRVFQSYLNFRLSDYISSFHGHKLGTRSKRYGDLRCPYFKKIRKLISENIGYDIDKGNYDEYAQKFGFMTKKEIIEFCKLRKPIKK